MPNLLGTAPNQVPTNADLGTMAFQDSAAVTVGSATVTTLNNNPVLSSGTANGVAYLNGSKVLTTGSALTFDGTKLYSSVAVQSGGTVTSANDFIGGGASGYAALYGNASGGIFIARGSTAGGHLEFYQNGTEGMRLTSTGLGIGTSSPAQRLDVQAADYVAIRALSTNSSIDTRLQSYSTGNYGYVGTVSNHAFSVITNNTERMRIDSSGNLLVGQTTQTNLDKVGVTFNGQTSNGIVLKTTYSGLNSTYVYFYNSAGSAAGNITQNGTTTIAYNTSSDYRLKENIQPMQNALATVAQLNPVTYTWKADGSDGQGFIAHELQAVVPDCVTGEKDAVDEEGKPVYQGIDTSFLVATLTKAIQELKAEVDSLKSQLENK